MALLRRSTLGMTRKPLPKKGSRSLAWEKCRSEKIEDDIDEEGLVHCEDWKLGLPKCGIAREPAEMDLHHSKGRDGNLLTDKRFLVWLIRGCHEAIHNR